MTSVTLAILSAALTHASIRYGQHQSRRIGLLLACLTFAGACYHGVELGGFWAGFYTLASVYFLVCIAMPWLDLLMRQRRAG